MTKYIINRCQAYTQYSGEGFILSGSEHPSSPWKAKPGEAASPSSFSQLRHWFMTSGQKHSPETWNEEQVAQRDCGRGTRGQPPRVRLACQCTPGALAGSPQAWGLSLKCPVVIRYGVNILQLVGHKCVMVYNNHLSSA